MSQFKFLLIEDESIAQIIVRHIIEEEGYYLDIAESSAEARTLLEKNQYAMIFLDCNLADTSGIEFCTYLREYLHITSPIVAVTAFEAANKQQECLQNGFSDYMEKPFSKQKFKNIVDKFL